MYLMTPKLYACLGSGNCFKAWLALQQLGLSFEFHSVDVLSGEQKSAEFLAINPLGVVPYLVTPDGQGIGESNAMLWYLAEDTWLMPSSREDRAAALQWMFFEQSKLEPFISPARFFTTIVPSAKSERADDIAHWQRSAEPGLSRLNDHLTKSEFMVAGRYSLADIAVFGYTHVIEEAGISLANYPSIERWIDTIEVTKNFKPLSKMGPAQAAVAA